MKRLILAALALSLFAETASAVSVQPYRIFVRPDQKVVELDVTNDTDIARTYDIRVKEWTGYAPDGSDALYNQSAIATSRPVITVPAGKTAVMRLFVMRAGMKYIMEDYRVLVTDITPDFAAPDGKSQIVSKTNLVLPLFVFNKDMETFHAKLTLADGKLCNSGTMFARIHGWKTQAGKNVDRLHYLFPGETGNCMDIPGVTSVADVRYDDETQ
jgi:P pilus assembly chaperone PapD